MCRFIRIVMISRNTRGPNRRIHIRRIRLLVPVRGEAWFIEVLDYKSNMILRIVPVSNELLKFNNWPNQRPG